MESKIKLAFIVTRLCGGGAATAIRNLARSIDRDRYHITLMYGQLDEAEVDVSAAILPCFDQTIQLKWTRRSFSFVRDHFATQEIQAHIRQEGFDIIHTHTSKAGFVGRLAAHREKVKLIIHSTHGSIFSEGANIPGVSGLKKAIFLFAERWASRWCHKILTLSVREIDQWLDLRVGYADQFSCLPSPVEVDLFEQARSERNSIRSNLSISKDVAVVLILGRLAAEKGHLTALEAFVGLENTELWIVGEGPMKGMIESKISELNIEDRVRMLGHKHDVEEWLPAVDVLLLNSSYEGQGLVLIEAMAAGVAVLASDVGGVGEIVQNEVTGMLFPYGNILELKKSMIKILSNVEFRQSLIDGADKKYPEYSCAKIARLLEKHYQLDA